MKKLQKRKKGFTLTELAIVIAVIAILIAVLVPTFVSLIGSANESADQQAVKSMNTALATDEVLNGKPDSAADAVVVLEEAGFNVENYQALESGNTIYYDLSYNRCLIWSSEDSKVTYPSDMVSAYSNVTGIAANWYTFETIYKIKDQTTPINSTNVSTADSVITSAISSAKSGETVIIELEENLGTVTLSSALSNSTGSYVTIDLNGNTLDITYSNSSNASNGSTLYIKDGTISESVRTDTSISVFSADADSSITLENVNVTSYGSVCYPSGNAAQINIIDSTLSARGYCVGTNAQYSNNISINIQNSTLTSASTYGATAVLMNVPGTMNITDCTITGQLQGVFVRAGTATITNSTITSSQTSSVMSTDITWSTGTSFSSGNAAAMGAVVVGDTNSDSYNADANVTLNNCVLSADVTIDDDKDNSYLEYAISLYVIDKDSNYNATATVNNCTMNNYVINWESSASLSYTGEVYTGWANNAWTK